jgi:hypothetical protein
MWLCSESIVITVVLSSTVATTCSGPSEILAITSAVSVFPASVLPLSSPTSALLFLFIILSSPLLPILLFPTDEVKSSHLLSSMIKLFVALSPQATGRSPQMANESHSFISRLRPRIHRRQKVASSSFRSLSLKSSCAQG